MPGERGCRTRVSQASSLAASSEAVKELSPPLGQLEYSAVVFLQLLFFTAFLSRSPTLLA